MAKDKFYPRKPHINGESGTNGLQLAVQLHQVRNELIRSGISWAGVDQLLDGRIVISPKDRANLAEFLTRVCQ